MKGNKKNSKIKPKCSKTSKQSSDAVVNSKNSDKKCPVNNIEVEKYKVKQPLPSISKSKPLSDSKLKHLQPRAVSNTGQTKKVPLPPYRDMQSESDPSSRAIISNSPASPKSTTQNPQGVTWANVEKNGFVMNTHNDKIVLKKKLGEGAYGKVFLAEMSSTKMALKVVLDKSVSALVSIEKEARILKKLSHPNITSFIDKIHIRDAVLMCMSLEGNTLQCMMFEKRTKEKISPTTTYACAWAMTNILDGVQYLHDLGIIHVDLKPGNVCQSLTESGFPLKIVDFGTARERGEHPFKCSVGTTAYYSPSHVLQFEVTFPADLWAVGIIGYELYAGREFFKGDAEKDLYRQLHYLCLLPADAKKAENFTILEKYRLTFKEIPQMSLLKFIEDRRPSSSSEHKEYVRLLLSLLNPDDDHRPDAATALKDFKKLRSHLGKLEKNRQKKE